VGEGGVGMGSEASRRGGLLSGPASEGPVGWLRHVTVRRVEFQEPPSVCPHGVVGTSVPGLRVCSQHALTYPPFFFPCPVEWDVW